MEVEEIRTLREESLVRPVLDSLIRHTARRTPGTAVHPDRGIFAIEHKYFGRPPNVDGDGRVDVLLLDIEDQFEHTGSYVAGFFDPNDLTTGKHSNRRDLLYIDTRPTMVRGRNGQRLRVRRAAATIAHEYQHLIHANYEGERREHTFVNEGLSEFAEILCGYPPRRAAAHLGAPGRPLLSWNYRRPLPDYARASLFTHYLFEQIGARWADDLVQNREIGLDGLRSVLREAGGPSFSVLFRNWGRALLLNDRSVDPAYGYRHSARRDVRFESTTVIEGIPGKVEIRTGALSHVPVRIPLVDRLSIQSHSPVSLDQDAWITYPGAPNHLHTGLGEGEIIEADRARHGSVHLLATNLTTTPDSERVGAQFLTHGRRSAQRRALNYGDGVPDAYSGNASYLLLDEPGEAVGVAFDPVEGSWLYEAAVDVVFASELGGANVPADTPRRLTLRIRSLDEGRPGPALTPPLTRTVDRSVGHLRMEPVSLLRQYDTLSALQDSFVVILQSARPSNPLAVGMDRTAGEARPGAAFHRGAMDASWDRLSTVRAEGHLLGGFRPMIQARTAVPERRMSAGTLTLDTSHEVEHAYIRLQAPFSLDSTRTHLYARLPSGTLVEGSWVRNPIGETSLEARSPTEAVFSLPSGTGADYHLYARARAEDGRIVRRHRHWRIPDEEAVQIGEAAPNPSAGPVRLPLSVLDPSRVTLTLYDALGRAVRTLSPRRVKAGTHDLPMRLRNLASGVYLIRVKVRRIRDGNVAEQTRKIVRVR
jgi:hypothetical protein